VVYLLSFDRMSDTNDAAQDSGCRGCVVPVTAVAAEPEQDEQNGQKERAAQSYECYQPRVLEVYTRSIITNLLHRSQQELRCRSETASYRKHRPKPGIFLTKDRQEIAGISECALVYRHLWPSSIQSHANKYR